MIKILDQKRNRNLQCSFKRFKRKSNFQINGKQHIRLRNH